MPSTVNVNKKTVVHAGSSGMSMSFPDVCKTPSPGGPIPIPYPNIAQSSDTADGSSTVKVDGKPIMLKSSNFKMSTGDEAGSLNGVISNKIKGKATPINASFDVKVDGKNVFRLTDPMQANGASGNAPVPAEVQAPLPEGILGSEECEKVKEKRENQDQKHTQKRSGMLQEHFDAIQKIADQFKVIFYFRGTDPLCEDWIRAKHQPKPHKVFKGNTIKDRAMEDGRRMPDWVQDWLNQYEEKVSKSWWMRLWGSPSPRPFDAATAAAVEAKISDKVRKAQLLGSNAIYSRSAQEYFGVVGHTRPGNTSEPMKAIRGAVCDSGCRYSTRWITADYDIFMLIRAVAGCEEVSQGSRDFVRIRKAINQTLGWDAIQHGPQTQWVASKSDVKLGAPQGTNFPKLIKKGFQENNPTAELAIPGRPKGMKVFDGEITVIAPKTSVFLETQKETFDALKCRECDKK